MKVKLVTGYIKLADSLRGPNWYWLQGQNLLQCSVPLDTWLHESISDTWYWRFLGQVRGAPGSLPVRPVPSYNPGKDTVAYMAVQHQKTAWLVKSLVTDNVSDVFVWVDMGIFHQPGVTVPVIDDFVGRVREASEVVIPGCWDEARRDEYLTGRDQDYQQPCWRFCGSVLIVPRDLVMPFHYACQDEARRHLINDRRMAEWEVNTWARVERLGTAPIRWYKADHNASMFTNYQPSREIVDVGPAAGASVPAQPADQRDGARFGAAPGHPLPIVNSD